MFKNNKGYSEIDPILWVFYIVGVIFFGLLWWTSWSDNAKAKMIYELRDEVSALKENRKKVISFYETKLKTTAKETENLNEKIEDLQNTITSKESDLEKYKKYQTFSMVTWILIWIGLVGAGGLFVYGILRNEKKKKYLDDGIEDVDNRARELYRDVLRSRDEEIKGLIEKYTLANKEKSGFENELGSLKTENERLLAHLEKLTDEASIKDQKIVNLTKKVQERAGPYESGFI